MTLAKCNADAWFANFASLKSRLSLKVARKVAPCDSALSFLLFLQKNEVKPDLPEQPVSEAVDTPKSSKVCIYIAVD